MSSSRQQMQKRANSSFAEICLSRVSRPCGFNEADVHLCAQFLIVPFPLYAPALARHCPMSRHWPGNCNSHDASGEPTTSPGSIRSTTVDDTQSFLPEDQISRAGTSIQCWRCSQRTGMYLPQRDWHALGRTLRTFPPVSTDCISIHFPDGVIHRLKQ